MGFLLIKTDMASKRMFSKEIVGSDAFQDMPASSQLLYFHLGMEADDDGFIGNPKKIARSIGMAEDDMKILIAKRFVLLFDSGVLVIKHHRINNNWDKHNCKRTIYLEEFNQLFIKENKAYTKDKTQGIPVQSENSLKTVSRIEENRIEENTQSVRVSSLKSLPGITTGDSYQADGFSPKDRLAMKKRLEKSLGLKKTNTWSNLLFGSAWDFLTAFEKYQGYKYPDNVLLDEVSKTLAKWYELGETRETVREMLIAFFEGKKSDAVTVTPNSVFSSHTYNSWKQNKL